MAKKKLQRFAEMKHFKNVVEVPNIYHRKDFDLKGNWKQNHFKNDNDIVLELGCGKGEYTLGLSRLFPDRNFIGVDIKGSRIWKGIKQALEENLENVAFLRTYIDHIEAIFGHHEISEIWITFPDPQPQKNRIRKRLTSPLFIERYKNILEPGGLIHLKTDNQMLYEYTLETIEMMKLKNIAYSNDLYATLNPVPQGHFSEFKEQLAINTYYEKKFLEEGLRICYLCFGV